MSASLFFTLIALVYSIQRLSKDGNTTCTMGVASCCTFVAFVASLVGLIWFYEKCLDEIDGTVEDVSFYLAVVTTAVQLLAMLLHIVVPPWREPEMLPPLRVQALPARETPREEFWDVVEPATGSSVGAAANQPPASTPQQVYRQGQGTDVGPRVIYSQGGPPQVSNYEAYGYGTQMPVQYIISAPHQMQRRPNQVQLDYAYPINSGYVREYVM